MDELTNEAGQVKNTLSVVGNQIYKTYKPPDQGGKAVPIEQNSGVGRLKTSNAQQVKAFETQAASIDHWFSTAREFAQRIFAELLAFGQIPLVNLNSTSFGTDTKTQADVSGTRAIMTPQGPQTPKIVTESKSVDSTAQGQVDTHVMAATKQLEKRRQANQAGPNGAYIATITIRSRSNTWPYTPTEYGLSSLTNPKYGDLGQKLKARLVKYVHRIPRRGSTEFQIHFKNPNLPQGPHVLTMQSTGWRQRSRGGFSCPDPSPITTCAGTRAAGKKGSPGTVEDLHDKKEP